MIKFRRGHAHLGEEIKIAWKKLRCSTRYAEICRRVRNTGGASRESQIPLQRGHCSLHKKSKFGRNIRPNFGVTSNFGPTPVLQRTKKRARRQNREYMDMRTSGNNFKVNLRRNDYQRRGASSWCVSAVYRVEDSMRRLWGPGDVGRS